MISLSISVLAFIVSFAVIIAGITANYWFWWIPSARVLRRRAEECRRLDLAVRWFTGTTDVFIDTNPVLSNRTKILDRYEMLEDRVGDMTVHFFVFVLVQLIFLFSNIVRASEDHTVVGETVKAVSGAVPADGPTMSGFDSLVLIFQKNWYAPYIETVFFFMVVYAIFIILRDVNKLNHARIS